MSLFRAINKIFKGRKDKNTVLNNNNNNNNNDDRVPKNKNKILPKFVAIPDKYESLDEVGEALCNAGLESSNLIIGIDYTGSNAYQGRKTFDGRNLHDTTVVNPYEQVINIMGQTLARFDEDGKIPCYGFGDTQTKDKTVFSLKTVNNWEQSCNGFNECIELYKFVTPTISLSGPTSFGPIIRQAINIVKNTNEYHILIIIGDGAVDRIEDTSNAIVEASKYPLSIIMIGVGDGPWYKMKEFDDQLPKRLFDNFQFVDFHECFLKSLELNIPLPIVFSVAALQEIPQQFNNIKNLGYLN